MAQFLSKQMEKSCRLIILLTDKNHLVCGREYNCDKMNVLRNINIAGGI